MKKYLIITIGILMSCGRNIPFDEEIIVGAKESTIFREDNNTYYTIYTTRSNGKFYSTKKFSIGDTIKFCK